MDNNSVESAGRYASPLRRKPTSPPFKKVKGGWRNFSASSSSFPPPPPPTPPPPPLPPSSSSSSLRTTTTTILFRKFWEWSYLSKPVNRILYYLPPRRKRQNQRLQCFIWFILSSLIISKYFCRRCNSVCFSRAWWINTVTLLHRVHLIPPSRKSVVIHFPFLTDSFRPWIIIPHAINYRLLIGWLFGDTWLSTLKCYSRYRFNSIASQLWYEAVQSFVFPIALVVYYLFYTWDLTI